MAKDGFFKVTNVKPGVYDLFVGGDDGIAVVGFEAIAMDDKTVANSKENPLLVAAQTEVSNTLCCELVQPSDHRSPSHHARSDRHGSRRSDHR